MHSILYNEDCPLAEESRPGCGCRSSLKQKRVAKEAITDGVTACSATLKPG